MGYIGSVAAAVSSLAVPPTTAVAIIPLVKRWSRIGAESALRITQPLTLMCGIESFDGISSNLKPRCFSVCLLDPEGGPYTW